MGNVLVLNYHKVLPDNQQTKENKYAITYSNFEKQLACIQKNGIPIVSINSWLKGEFTGDFGVAITIDGGHDCGFENVYPLLKAEQISATYFPILFYVGRPHHLNWDQLLEMLAESDIAIGSHGVFHQNMRKLSKDACKLELELSRRIMEKELKCSVNLFSAPFGLYNRQLLRLAYGAGYSKVFVNGGKLNASPDNFLISRWNIKRSTTIEQFEKNLLQKRKGQRTVSWPQKTGVNLSNWGISVMNRVSLFMSNLNQENIS